MGKYLVLWEVDQARVPVSPQERGAGWLALLDIVKEDLKKGMKDWGAFAGEINGYGVYEGTELELGNMLQQYVPWVIFKVRSITSWEQVYEMSKALTK